MSLQASLDHAHTHQPTFLEQFKELLRIPSISTDPAYQPQVQRAADWVAQEMKRIGLENCRAIPGQGHPVVYGEWLQAGADRPTVLIYAHYDVQPVDPLELWESPPFEPSIRQGRLYARGVADDKCGVFINLKALESILRASGRLPVNVKLFFEGDEESGSLGMEAFIRQHKDMLRADLLVISDGGSPEDQPQIFSTLRGIVSAEVLVSGPQHDLHSGTYGGIVHNPIHLAAKIIAAFHDERGQVQIPGFYNDVAPLSAAELEYLQEIEPSIRRELEQHSGVRNFWGAPEYSLVERQTARPTCDVNGVYGGYAGQGDKTIIPAQAGFKVSLRLVANQDPDDIAAKFTAFVQSFACDTLDIQVSIHSKYRPVRLLSEGPPVEAIHRAFEAAWGKRALVCRQGGSVPVMDIFQRELGIPIASLGYAVGGNGHAPNEYYILDYFGRSLDTAIHFFHNLAELASGANP